MITICIAVLMIILGGWAFICPDWQFNWGNPNDRSPTPAVCQVDAETMSPQMKKSVVFDAVFLFCWPLLPLLIVALDHTDGTAISGAVLPMLLCFALTIPLFIVSQIFSSLVPKKERHPQKIYVTFYIIRILSITSYLLLCAIGIYMTNNHA